MSLVEFALSLVPAGLAVFGVHKMAFAYTPKHRGVPA